MQRRRFLRISVAALGALGTGHLYPLRGHADAGTGAVLSPAHVKKLNTSPYVYVSPLLEGGAESSCHGEVWFAWLDDCVVVTVASDRWKVRAIDRGLTRARIWVGDYGRWKNLGIANEAFREAPSFDANAEKSRDTGLGDRLLEAYGTRYPDEIDRWRDKMRKGLEDGTRTLIRYTPVSAR